MSLPRKDQLLILTLARLSEPLTQTSIHPYMFYQLKSFNPDLPDSAISSQAGLIAGAFTACQFLTAIAWGRAADSELLGRKTVLIIGLFGSALSVLGYGFARNFYVAIVFRCLDGALNGNIGVMRTLISEIIKEKRFQSRAFMIMPMTFNIGVIIGPMLGGWLSDPIQTFPGIFGPDSLLGGKDGVYWMTHWPYALPNIISAVFLIGAGLCLWLGLEETHEMLQHKPDTGLRMGRWIVRKIFRRNAAHGYSSLAGSEAQANDDTNSIELLQTPTTPKSATSSLPIRRKKLPFRRIWTRNIVLNLISHGLLASHVGTFSSLSVVFLSTSRFDPKHPNPPSHRSQRPPLHFTGGLSLPSSRIGLVMSIIGVIGITLQLTLYPWLSGKYGNTKPYRLSLLLFPFSYLLLPFIALLPSTTSPPSPAAGPAIWLGITGVLFIQTFARTFALPGTTILTNNSCPHPSVLGTVHGVAQSVSSGMRTITPVVAGWVYGWGLKMAVVGTAFWFLMGLAVMGAFAGGFVRDGSGKEIVLEGEEEEED
ncbi:MFS general substrate transporter, partial [Aulographum hederae CBS 113979]